MGCTFTILYSRLYVCTVQQSTPCLPSSPRAHNSDGSTLVNTSTSRVASLICATRITPSTISAFFGVEHLSFDITTDPSLGFTYYILRRVCLSVGGEFILHHNPSSYTVPHQVPDWYY